MGMIAIHGRSVLAALAAALVAVCARAEDKGVTLVASDDAPGALHESLRNEVDAAIDRGLDWLAAQQKEDGSWSNRTFPGPDGAAALGLPRNRHPGHAGGRRQGRRATFCRCVQDDGGIYRHVAGRKGGGLSNYNTAICMTALHATGDPALAPVVQKARAFIAGAQHFGDDVYHGGFGYDQEHQARLHRPAQHLLRRRGHAPDTQDVEDLRPPGEKRVDIDWSETVKFIERMQNKPEAGRDNAGGFFYNPADPKAGTATNEAGRRRLPLLRQHHLRRPAGPGLRRRGARRRARPVRLRLGRRTLVARGEPRHGRSRAVLLLQRPDQALWTAYGRDLIPLGKDTLAELARRAGQEAGRRCRRSTPRPATATGSTTPAASGRTTRCSSPPTACSRCNCCNGGRPRPLCRRGSLLAGRFRGVWERGVDSPTPTHPPHGILAPFGLAPRASPVLGRAGAIQQHLHLVYAAIATGLISVPSTGSPSSVISTLSANRLPEVPPRLSACHRHSAKNPGSGARVTRVLHRPRPLNHNVVCIAAELRRTA